MRKQSFQQRQNHHSLTKKNPIFSRHCLEESVASSSFTKKMSTSSLKNYIDIDRLIDDIKIVPQKTNQINEHIKIIINSLQILKQFSTIVDEVRTIELLLDSITKKLASDALSNTRLKQNQSAYKQSHYKNCNISPVKQIDDNSRIVYTNFSLKEISLPSHQFQIEREKLETPIKRFNYDKDQNDQMEKLNTQIQALEKMLKVKGVRPDIPYISNTSHKFQQSNITSTVKSKNIKENHIVPKKYSLLQKTQQISLSKQKPNIPQRTKFTRLPQNYFR